MKTLEKRSTDQKSKFGEVIIDKSLNDFPTPPAALKKIEEAREFLKKHPIPKDLKW